MPRKMTMRARKLFNSHRSRSVINRLIRHNTKASIQRTRFTIAVTYHLIDSVLLAYRGNRCKYTFFGKTWWSSTKKSVRVKSMMIFLTIKAYHRFRDVRLDRLAHLRLHRSFVRVHLLPEHHSQRPVGHPVWHRQCL
jgi:hypothetical protein